MVYGASCIEQVLFIHNIVGIRLISEHTNPSLCRPDQNLETLLIIHEIGKFYAYIVFVIHKEMEHLRSTLEE